MIKKVYFIYILIFITYSCDNLVNKKNSREEVLEKKWSEVDTNQVDKPPLFDSCLHEPEELDNCFQQTVMNHIKTHIANNIVSVKQPINDTIWIPLLITKRRKIVLEEFTLPEIVTTQIPNFSDVLKESIKTLPRVEPAIVRSTPVTSRYRLPIVIHMN